MFFERNFLMKRGHKDKMPRRNREPSREAGVDPEADVDGAMKRLAGQKKPDRSLPKSRDSLNKGTK
jgi:hypothetical protein